VFRTISDFCVKHVKIEFLFYFIVEFFYLIGGFILSVILFYWWFYFIGGSILSVVLSVHFISALYFIVLL